MMSGEAPAAASDWEDLYKDHVATVVLKAITLEGRVETYSAFREVMTVTGRTLSTIKNWLAYRSNLPDLASMVKICTHWGIPAEALMPSSLMSELSGNSPDNNDRRSQLAKHPSAVELIPIKTFESDRGRDAIAYYTSNPEKALFVRQEEADNEQIRQGELVMVDPTIESLGSDGFYLLQVRRGEAGAVISIRYLATMLGTQAVRVSRSSLSLETSETIALTAEGLPTHVSVLGKILAVMRKL